SWENVYRYGIAGVDKTMRRLSRFPKGHVHRVDELIEKPERDAAPSNLGVVGGYVLTPRLIRNLRKMFRMLKSRHADALRIIDGFQRELVEHHHVYGWEFSGKRLDCGNLEGYYEAEEYLRRKKGR
ncbi:MAG: sugar phosphate nucleotidyltransferase, partial [Patescibacteria group bacterium]